MSRRRTLLIVAVTVAVAAGGWLAWHALRPAPSGAAALRAALGSEHPNIILVTIDTLRADHLGSYGSDVRTPALDRLAREGARFANAATTVPFTLPAHSSIMTGAYPPYHGVRENVGYVLGEDLPTLAETLGGAGYATAAFVSAFVLDSQWGIGRGFAEYHDDFDVTEIRGRNLGSVQRDGAETVEAALGWLDARPAGSFFLWMHLFDPHDPYTPAEPYASQYPGRPYAGEVAYVDALVGRFREQLEARGLLDTSLIVITGDHGEGLGDHGEAYHGYFIYESTARVPLIVRAPGMAGEQVLQRAVSHVDLFPTLLEIAGLPVPPGAQGRSLVPLLVGEPEAGAAERVVYTESYYALLHYGWAPLRSLRTARYKYIDAPQEELYELPEDPSEESNLARQRAATSFELREALLQLVDRVKFEGERDAPLADLDEDTLQQLRALGYIAGRGAVDVHDEGVARADPKDKIQLHQLIMAAQSETGRGEEERAEATLREVLRRDPQILDANQMVGNILAKRGAHDEAVPFFRRALEIDPAHEPSLFGLATAYRRLGRVDEALVGYRRLLEIHPTDSKTVLATADILVERAQLGDATRLLREIVDSGEKVPPMLYNKLGELLVLQGRPQPAEAWFARARDANDELAQPYFNLAVLYEERGEVPRAMELYEAAIERAADHYQARFNLGRLAGLMGDVDRQVQLFEAALESNPDFVQGYFLLGKLLMDTGRDLARAEELVRDGLARDPDGRAGPLGYFVLADILNRRGRSAEAEQALRRGRQIQAR